MKIVLMRHGPAIEREVFLKKSQLDDSQRPLTDKGRKKVFEVCQSLHDKGLRVGAIVSSPFVRSQQSAKEALRIFIDAEYFESIELTPASPPAAFSKWLKTQVSLPDSILVIGHEPQLGSFATYLLSKSSQESFIEFKKAGVLCLEVESLQDLRAGTALLRWLLPPKLIL